MIAETFYSVVGWTENGEKKPSSTSPTTTTMTSISTSVTTHKVREKVKKRGE